MKMGWQLEAIEQRLSEIRANTEVIYTLETLDYLARGGRIGRVQALAGSLLKIKPVIRVDHEDGKYSTVGQGRTIKKTIDMIGEHLQEMYGDAAVWATVLHGKFDSGAAMLAELLQERLNIKKLEIMRISPVLGVHTGPGIVGAAIVPTEYVDDLVEA